MTSPVGTCALPHGYEHAAEAHGGVAHDAGADLGAERQRLVRQVEEVVRDEEHEEEHAGRRGRAVGWRWGVTSQRPGQSVSVSSIR